MFVICPYPFLFSTCRVSKLSIDGKKTHHCKLFSCYVLFTFALATCYPKGCAAPGEVPCQCNTRRLLSKLKKTLPQRKIGVTSKSPFGDISVVTLIRTDTTLDHSQKAEKVCSCVVYGVVLACPCVEAVLFVFAFFPCICAILLPLPLPGALNLRRPRQA